MINKVLRIGILFDFYGALLTEKQRLCMEMHYLNDFSLSEIADEFGVSRQAVHDILKRAEQILLDYEEKLKLAERYQTEQRHILYVYELLNRLPEETQHIPEIKTALLELQGLLDCSKEV